MPWKYLIAVGMAVATQGMGQAATAPTQTAQRAESARSTRNAFTALNQLETLTPSDEFAPSSAADSDLGEQLILTRRERYRPFSLTVNSNTLWLSNALYSPSSPMSDVLMGASAGFLALPHLGNNFFLEGSADFSGYRYFRNPSLDFQSLRATAGVLKIFREFYDVGLYGHYQYDYLFGRESQDLLQEHMLSVGLRKTFQINRANALFASAEASFVVGGEPSYALAHTFTLFAAHQIQWSRWMGSSLYYQMRILAFTESDGRADINNSLGVSLDFLVLRWLRIYANSWLAWNESNQSGNNYFAATLGGGVTASINF